MQVLAMGQRRPPDTDKGANGAALNQSRNKGSIKRNVRGMPDLPFEPYHRKLVQVSGVYGRSMII